MTELADYLRPPDRNVCVRCNRFVRRVWVDGWNATARCHGAEETRTFSLTYIEDAGRRREKWFTLKPEHEFRDSKIDRHGYSVGHWQDSTRGKP